MIHNLAQYLFGIIGNDGAIDRTAFWTAMSACIGLLSAIIAIISLWVVFLIGYKQLKIALKEVKETSKTSKEQSAISKADFIYKFTQDFFTKDTRQLIMLFDCNLLTFDKVSKGKTEYPFFTLASDDLIKERTGLTNAELAELKSRKELKQKYSGYEIDDNLLGFFEDISDFVKREILDFDQAYGSFDWYVETIWDNGEIRKYIASERKRYGSDTWGGFEEIYNRCKSYKNK